jgi:hypothetical protein
MANPTVGKVGANAVNQIRDIQKQGAGPKLSPSKFEKVRAELGQQIAASLKLQPPVTEVSAQQRKTLENDLRKRLKQSDVRTVEDVFKVQMKSAQGGIEELKRTVAAMPKIGALDPLKQRLKDIESQFNASGNALSGLNLNDPGSLLQMQIQIYQVTQNVEVMSKVVDGVSSGIKTVLQTQV